MRKIELIHRISEKTGVPKVDVLVTLEAVFREIKCTLVTGENVYLRGFGSFVNKKRATKYGRDIKRNSAVLIPEHFIPVFRPALKFAAAIKHLTDKNNEHDILS